MPTACPWDTYARCYTRTLLTPTTPFPSGGGAAAGERGGGLGMSAGVATNVKLPRTSRGHPRLSSLKNQNSRRPISGNVSANRLRTTSQVPLKDYHARDDCRLPPASPAPTDRFVWSSSNPNFQCEQGGPRGALPLPLAGRQQQLIFTQGGLSGPRARWIRSSRMEWSCHGWGSVDRKPGVLEWTLAALALLTIPQAEFLCRRHLPGTSPQKTFRSTAPHLLSRRRRR